MTHRRLPARSLLACVAVLAACAPERTSAPEAPEPPADDDSVDPDLAARVLPEGTYDVTYATCGACAPGAVPDYLLAFSPGVRGVVTITDAAEWHATLRLVELRAGEDPAADVLGLFGSPVVVLLWDEPSGAFEGRVPYGAAAEFLPSFRALGGTLRCDFDLFHAKHDVGPTSCTVSPRS